MTKLYIANCSKFVQDFIFRVPEVQQLFKTTIAVGGQNQVYKDTSREILEAIVDQHLKYGLIPVSEIDRTKGFFGLCYSFDTPINVEKMMNAIQHNDEALELRGHELRKYQAASLSDKIDNNLMGSESKLQGMEVEIQEQQKVGNNDPKMVETIQVAKPGSKAAARGAERAANA
jgi:hypothetical protein